MRNVDLIELANNPDLISEIYNYCDRWCERCPFTTRCLLYATEKADDDDDPASRDIRNAAFWQKLHSIFKQTKEMIVAWAKENGVDLEPAETDVYVQQRQAKRKNARKNPLAVAAERYAHNVNAWFETQLLPVETISDTASQLQEAELDADEDVNEAAEILRWYQYLIAAKIMRGLFADDDEVEEAEYPKDSDGSVKVALIAIDRSISAWRLMQMASPEKAESIVPLLLELESLRLKTERVFPVARDFVRPGFDEVGLDVIQ